MESALIEDAALEGLPRYSDELLPRRAPRSAVPGLPRPLASSRTPRTAIVQGSHAVLGENLWSMGLQEAAVGWNPSMPPPHGPTPLAAPPPGCALPTPRACDWHSGLPTLWQGIIM